MSTLPKVGSRICIIGDHPHRGKAATVLGTRRLPILNTLAAQCEGDDGSSFFVSKPGHWREFPTETQILPMTQRGSKNDKPA